MLRLSFPIACLFSVLAFAGDAAPAKSALITADQPPTGPSPAAVFTGPAKIGTLPPPVEQTWTFSDPPTDAEIASNRIFAEPLIPSPDVPQVVAEDQALAKLITAAIASGGSAGFGVRTEPFEAFLVKHPASRWAISLHLNLGLVDRPAGRFSRALDHFHAAWNAGRKHQTDALASTVDLAYAELMQLNAWVGRAAEIDALEAEAKGRQITGPASPLVWMARQGRAGMSSDPGTSFKCGPYAVGILACRRDGRPLADAAELVANDHSTEQGTSLSQIQGVAARLKLPHVAGFRTPGATLPIPSVIHWKLGHFSAVIAEKDGRYHVVDRTLASFRGDGVWIERADLDTETSGYFLADLTASPAGWRAVDTAEAATIHGRGFIGAPADFRACTLCDLLCLMFGPCGGMPQWSVHAMLVSLTVRDLPIWHTPPGGLPMEPLMVYNELDAHQPASPLFWNFGPKWTCAWQSWAKANGNGTVDVYEPGGGVHTYTISSGTTVSQRSAFTAATLRYRPGLAGAYHPGWVVDRPDGSSTEYTFADAPPGNVPWTGIHFQMTKQTDPRGRSLHFFYENTYKRLESVFDETTGHEMSLTYHPSADPRRVATIVDPFGRSASFTYNARGLLSSITDAVGLASSFGYQAETDAITGIATPHGTTSFQRGQTPRTHAGKDSSGNLDPNKRVKCLGWFIEATDPHGDVQRFENINFTEDPAVTVETRIPTGFGAQVLTESNSYAWDRKQYRLAAKDPDSGAPALGDGVLYHFLNHGGTTDSHGTTSRILHSTRRPGSSRVWFTYLGQVGTYKDDAITNSAPLETIQFVWAGAPQVLTEQRTRVDYDGLNRPILQTDALGRKTKLVWDGQDLSEIRSLMAGQPDELLGRFVWESNHDLRQAWDASNRSTNFTYHENGQPKTIVDAQGTLTKFTVNAVGFVESVLVGNALNPEQTLATATYYPDGMPETVTDVDGLTVTYFWDALRRPTEVRFADGTTIANFYEGMYLKWSKDRQGRWSRVMRDALGRPVAVRDPSGRQSVMEWCKCGALQALTDAQGRETRWTYDASGRMTSKTYPAEPGRVPQVAERYFYEGQDDHGVQVAPPGAGRLSRVRQADGTWSVFSYHLDGQIASVRWLDAAKQELTVPAPVTWFYEARYGRPFRINDGFGSTDLFYNPAITSATAVPLNGGGMLRQINGPFSNDAIDLTYDILGRTESVSMNGAVRSVERDHLGRVTRGTDPMGSSDYGWAGVTGRLESLLVGPAGQATKAIRSAFAWQPQRDQNGKLQHLRMIGINHRTGAMAQLSAHEYTYRADGMIATWTQQEGTTLPTHWTFGYDGSDQLTAASSTNEQWNWGYDQAGNRTGQSLARRSGTLWVHDRQGQDFNTLNQPVGAATNRGPLMLSGTVDEPATVTVNGVAARVEADGSWTAELPPNTGTQVKTIATALDNNEKATLTWTLPGNGTLLPRRFGYDTFDIRGRCLEDSAGRIYTWDAADRLSSITNGVQRTEFVYDGAGRRVTQREYDGSTLVADRRFVWIGSTIAEERTATDQVVKRYFDHGEQHLVGGAWQNRWYTRDHLGSIREVVDDTGTMLARYRYDFWGNRERVDGNVAGFGGIEKGYTGHWHHERSGLVLTLLRAYDPVVGRWLSRDPIEELKLYKYSSNNPLNRIDLFGGPDHHVYPLYLGGSDNQILIRLTDDQHKALHLFLSQSGVGRGNPGRACANWDAMSDEQRNGILRGALGAAGLSDTEIDTAMAGADLKGARPGTNRTTERKSGTSSKTNPNDFSKGKRTVGTGLNARAAGLLAGGSALLGLYAGEASGQNEEAISMIRKAMEEKIQNGCIPLLDPAGDVDGSRLFLSLDQLFPNARGPNSQIVEAMVKDSP